MTRDDMKFEREFPHIVRLFRVAKIHGIMKYTDLKDIVNRIYRCDVLELSETQAEELMHRIHFASPRKYHKPWHK
jgi:hypothetical protein